MTNVEDRELPTLATARAMLGQLEADRERSGYWRSRWAEDHSDQAIETWLRSLLDWLECAPQPLNSKPALGPVEGRGVAEIRADLATCDQLGIVPWPAAARRLLGDVQSLLAEVEAAHRFERSAAVEREALLVERDSLRGVVQAVAELAKDPIHECGETCEAWGCDVKGATYYVTLPKLRAALAAATDAPQPATCEHGKTERHTYGEVVSKHDAHWRPRVCPGPSPAVLPEGKATE